MTMELRMRLATTLLAASVLFALGPAGAWASVPVSGTLHAEKDCEAFVSKKKKSNPDKARLETGDSYVVLEMNRPAQPEWYRVRVDDANPPERWVEAGCGTLALRDAPDVGERPEPIRPDDPSLCSTAGLQDSFKLALSWQPAFCESHRSKKECGVSFPSTFQAAGNFTLHGLWPNREACGINYGNCEHVRQQREFCDYPALPGGGEAVEPGDARHRLLSGAPRVVQTWHLHGQASLTELIKTAPPDFRGRCPARFTIDAVGFAR